MRETIRKRKFFRGCRKKALLLSGLGLPVALVYFLWCLVAVPGREDIIEINVQVIKRDTLNHVTSATSTRAVLLPQNWVGFPELKKVNCDAAFEGSAKNKDYPGTVARIFPRDIIEAGSDCDSFRWKFGIDRNNRVSQEEKDFPIAFSILLYKDIDQVLFLLRAIYRPHNLYCLHIDSKSDIELFLAVQTVARCVPNVYIASKLEHIVYAGMTRLQADLTCMKDALARPVQWKYYINLPSQQFPLKTNLEMVRILKLFNGSNDVEGITGRRMLPFRFQWRYEYRTDDAKGELKIVRTAEKNPPPPHNLTVVKGSAYGTFSRAFVHFLFSSDVAQDLLVWMKGVYSPDEYFWATLHHSKVIDVPGGYRGPPDDKPWLSTYALWTGERPKCATDYVRNVCIFSVDDLPHLLTRKNFFANKFYITHHPAALHCLDVLIFDRSQAGYVGNLSYYETLPFLNRGKVRKALR